MTALVYKDRQYNLGGSYLCLDGEYIFLISTMHHLYEPKELWSYNKKYFIKINHHQPIANIWHALQVSNQIFFQTKPLLQLKKLKSDLKYIKKILFFHYKLNKKLNYIG